MSAVELNVSSAATGSTAFRTPTSRLTERTLVGKPSYASFVQDEPLEGGGITFPELDGREPAEQLEILRDMLEKTTHLKHGAVKFLKTEELTVGRLSLLW